MTVDESKRRLANYANSQIGYTEGANNWNKYAAELDKIDGLTWGAKQNKPWCGEFVLACFVACFGVDLGLKMQYSPKPTGIPLCKTGASYFQSAGQWYHKPQLCDVAFFYVGNAINHTGIVTNVGMGAITTVEGNSSDMVARRTYDINSPAIAGFGRPNWELAENYNPKDPDQATEDEDTLDPAPEPEPEKPEFLYHPYQYLVKINLLKLGDYGPQVRNMQLMLKDAGFDCPVNGEYDDATYTAVAAFQAENGLEDDGEFGGRTFEKLYNS